MRKTNQNLLDFPGVFISHQQVSYISQSMQNFRENKKIKINKRRMSEGQSSSILLPRRIRRGEIFLNENEEI